MPIMSDSIRTCQNSTIESGARVELEAKSCITLDVGFTVDLGGEFVGEISGVEYCGAGFLGEAEAEVEDDVESNRE